MSEMENRKLNLMPLQGDMGCFLEIELSENGDMYIGMRGQSTKAEVDYISAQIPNPINGGGNLEDYKTLRQIYDILKKPKIKK